MITISPAEFYFISSKLLQTPGQCNKVGNKVVHK